MPIVYAYHALTPEAQQSNSTAVDDLFTAYQLAEPHRQARHDAAADMQAIAADYATDELRYARATVEGLAAHVADQLTRLALQVAFAPTDTKLRTAANQLSALLDEHEALMAQLDGE